jgi:hypothetical protein
MSFPATRARPSPTAVITRRWGSGGRIIHADGTVAGRPNDDTDDCSGLDERHAGDPVLCWKWWGRCDRCGIRL